MQAAPEVAQLRLLWGRGEVSFGGAGWWEWGGVPGTVGVRLAPLSKNIVQKESAVFRILSLKQLF